MFRDCHSDLLPTGWGEYSGHHQRSCYNHLRCRHILVMVVFAITQQNVINAAQGLARGQPKFNGTHLTAISIAAHFELIMLREKTHRTDGARVWGIALCVSCIQGRRHGCTLLELFHILLDFHTNRASAVVSVLPLGGTISLWGKSSSNPIWLLCILFIKYMMNMTSICQISSKIGINGANNIIFCFFYQRQSKELDFIM